MNLSRAFALAILAITLGLHGCGKNQAPASELVVKIGSVAPLTGPQAHLGKDNDNGVRLAIEEVNSQNLLIGGKKVQFELISEDDQADPKTATIVAQKLVDQKVNAVIGHLNSGATIPASKIYHDAGVVQISPSATAIPYTQQGFKNAFRVMTNDAQQGKVLGDFAVQQMAAKKIAIIDDRTAYGQGLADQFEKEARADGAEILAREYTTDRATDFLAILTSIKGKQPDLVFYGGMDAQAGPMVKQMKSLGLNARFLGGDGTQSIEFIKLAGADAEGVTASSPGVPLGKMPGGAEFLKKFESKYGKIQIYAPYAYDAAMTLIEAMKQADSVEQAKYLPVLAHIQRNGVTGPIAFDAKGDVQGGAVTLYQVKSGKWEPLETLGQTATVSQAAAPTETKSLGSRNQGY
ncbi:MAG TPA: branched-chain amino acid ABC transporter substrate-binding protein [Burkholderiales bacterium]|nr:branched-chain amino acid ABC transporter substrate-binding protein [Burkholderiales bacterium]